LALRSELVSTFMQFWDYGWLRLTAAGGCGPNKSVFLRWSGRSWATEAVIFTTIVPLRTVPDLKLDYPELRRHVRQSTSVFGVSGASATIHENPSKRFIRWKATSNQ
jgi:hypothetical protein